MLHELQGAFRRAILRDPDAALLARELGIDPGAAARVAIHRDNALISLAEVLKAAYPVVCQVAGEGFFRHAAREYVRAHPPRAPQLWAYGRKFEKFLERYEPARPLPFLPDLARLEWAWNESYFAADAAPLDPAALQALAPERTPRLQLAVHPSARVVASGYPILRIWRDNDPLARATAPLDEPRAGRHVLVVRPDHEVHTHALGEGAFTFILALKAGLALEHAATAATGVEPDFDLQGTLAALLAWSTFTGFSVPQQRRGFEDDD